MVCTTNDEWFNMNAKVEMRSLDSSEYVQVDAEFSKNDSIEVLNNLDS
jgi:hypothetical protein